MKKLFTSIALISIIFSNISAQAISNKGFRPDMTFLDFEELSGLFNGHHKQVVHIINHKDSPVTILEAEVSDRGTVFFKGLSGARNTYSITVQNNTNRKILAYQVTWILKHPFEDYVFHKIHSNSINLLDIGETQELKFRRSKHYRDDAYYNVEVTKVEFDDDESIWEAPELEDSKTHTRLEEVKKEIDEMEEMDEIIDDETLKALKEKYNEQLRIDSGELDQEENLKDKVLLKEVTKEKTTTVEIEEVEKVQPVKSKTVTKETNEYIETETVETKTVESKASSQEPILDPQELMKAVDSLIRSKEQENLILESDLVNSSPIKETTTIETKVIKTQPIVETKVIETTTVETKPVVKTLVETKVIETQPVTNSVLNKKIIEKSKEVKTQVIDNFSDDEDDDFDGLDDEDDWDDEDFDDEDFDDEDFDDDDF